MANTLTEFIDANADFRTNKQMRVPICLCIDVSESMRLNRRIDMVNEGVEKFIRESRENIYASGAVDIAIVTFGGQQARVHMPFTIAREIKDFTPLTTHGGTPLGEAVQLALTEIKNRKNAYEDHTILSFKPWLVIMSDGLSDDDVTDAAYTVRRELAARKIKLMCVDMSGSNESGDLKKFTLDGKVETISALEIGNFFDMLSRSAAGLSTEVGSDE